jgi:hypothetical protein
VLAAIGICALAAISGYPETASFLTECDYGSWRGRAGNRLVRSSLAAVRIGAGSDVVLACVSSSFTEVRANVDDRPFRSVPKGLYEHRRRRGLIPGQSFSLQQPRQ